MTYGKRRIISYAFFWPRVVVLPLCSVAERGKELEANQLNEQVCFRARAMSAC